MIAIIQKIHVESKSHEKDRRLGELTDKLGGVPGLETVASPFKFICERLERGDIKHFVELIEYYALTEKIPYNQIFWLLCYSDYKSAEKTKTKFLINLMEGVVMGVTGVVGITTRQYYVPVFSLVFPFILSQVNEKINAGKDFDDYRSHIEDLKKEARIELPDFLFDDE